MKQLDARLTAVAALVREGSRVADIGTDHALLPVWLVRTGRCPAAVASDIRQGPAAAARRQVEKAALSDRISVRVGDGLAPLAPGEAEDIVIAGMGGETVAEILAAAPWVRNKAYHLVLQPMSKPEKLRQFLWENGFSILSEQIVPEGDRLYSVMSVAFTGEILTPSSGDCFLGRIPRTDEGAGYLKKQRGRILERLQGLENRENAEDERMELQQALAQIDAWLTRDNT